MQQAEVDDRRDLAVSSMMAACCSRRRLGLCLGTVLLLVGSDGIAAGSLAGGPRAVELLRTATEKKVVPEECSSAKEEEAGLACAYIQWKIRADATLLLGYRYEGAIYTFEKIDEAVRDYRRRGGGPLLDGRPIGDGIIEALFGLATRSSPGAVEALFRLGPGEGDYGENLDERYRLLFERYPALMIRSWDAIKEKLSDATLGTAPLTAPRDVIKGYKRECRRHDGNARQCREIIRFLRSRR